MPVSNDILRSLEAFAKSSAEISDELIQFLEAEMKGSVRPDIEWSERLFEELWAALDAAGILWNRKAHGHLALLQIIAHITAHITRESPWNCIHKGTFFYNLATVYISNGEAEYAFKYFQMADEENVRNHGSSPGDLFRSQKLFQELRDRFFTTWMTTNSNQFHDGLADDSRLDVVSRLIADIPDLYVLSRCHLGLFRTCLIYHNRESGVPPIIYEYLLAVEELTVLAEASAKRLHFGGIFKAEGTIGDTMKNTSLVGQMGFDLNKCSRIDLADQASTETKIKAARNGDRPAIARVVQRIRNLSAHPEPLPPWCLETSVLWDILLVVLDFITTVSAEVERVLVQVEEA